MSIDSNILRRLNENEPRSFLAKSTEDEDTMIDAFAKPRKRRLDHLTWEEKVQRKKLKNRVAAQTSRDRKKARMEHLEEAMEKLIAQNELVLAECESLKQINGDLRKQNMELRQAFHEQVSACNSCQHRRVECEGSLSGSTESGLFLLQQGRTPHSATALATLQTLQILLACLLCKTFLKSSTKTSISAVWTNLPRVCSRISPATLMQLIQRLNRAAMLVDPMSLEKWWGRHQNNWNPMGTVTTA